MLRKYLILIVFMIPFLLKAQIYLADNGLTVTGTGVNKKVQLGGSLLLNTSFDLGATFTYNIKKGTANYLHILNNGNIGFGTNAPTSSFDVVGASRFRNALTLNYGTANRTVQLTDAGLFLSRTSDGTYTNNITANTEMLFNTAGNYRFINNAVERFTILQSGNVGIGTTTDAGYKLDVINGPTRLSPNGSTGGAFYVATHGVYVNRTKFVVGATDGLDGVAGLVFSTETASGKTYINGWNDGGTAQYDLVINSNGGRTQFGTESASVPSAQVAINSSNKGFLKPRLTSLQRNAILTPATGLSIYNTTTNTEDYFNGTAWVSLLTSSSGSSNWNSNGNNIVNANTGFVSIGTSTNFAPTDPQLKLAVNGNVYAKKITITQQGWADYVFEPTYKLMPLSELEAYINKNKHLPEVPSATDVETKGLDLGDNQTILLKKIEELTLYVIELKKEIETMKADKSMPSKKK